MTIGDKIRLLRKQNDVTQEKLADYLGISYQSISKWENNTAMPDISLVVPLANFFGVTTDELFGMNDKKEKDDIEEFDKQIRLLGNQGKVHEALDLCRTMAVKYPRNYHCLEMFAAMLLQSTWTSGFTNEEQDAAKKEGIKLCKRIMEDCTDDSVRSGVRQTLVFFYDLLGDSENAIKTANDAPNIFFSRESLLDHIYSDPERQKRQKSENTLTFAQMLTSTIWARQYENDDEKIKAYKACISIWETVIDDGNYLFYHIRLFDFNRYIARTYAVKQDERLTMEYLKRAKYHAEEYEILPTKMMHYSGIFVKDTVFNPFSVSKNYTQTTIELLKESLKESCFDFLRSKNEFIEFQNSL